MTITLAAIDPNTGLVMKAAVLGIAGIFITIAVYGSVALIVKADDAGLAMAAKGRLSTTRALGRGIVKAMPYFMQLLVIVGTAAMVWVGGSIIIHGLHELGVHGPYDLIHGIAVGVANGSGAIEWAVTAFLDGVVGLILGFILIPTVSFVIAPIAGLFRRGTKSA